MPPVPVVSNSQANRAGREFRRIFALMREAGTAAERVALLEDWWPWRDVIEDYRSMHEYPLRKVTMGVRKMAETCLGAGAPRPTQRFKRMDRILSKLSRHRNMALSTMQDIGGCRIVVPTLQDVRRLQGHILRAPRWRDSIVDDHSIEPKHDGYRSVHIITKRDGRWIEVQIRTNAQERWATAVEEAEALTGFDVKDGNGPADLLDYFRLAAERLSLEDQGLPADPEVEQMFAVIRDQIRPYYVQP